MASKSVAQRLVEVIAVVAVLGFGVVVAISVWTNRPKPKEDPYAKIGAPSAPTVVPPPPDLTPKREDVASLAELPAHYPKIDELKLAPDIPPSLALKLPTVAPGQLGNAKVRHLNAYAFGRLSVDSPAEHAVVLEVTPARTYRFAVWNLSTGKLVRFLSEEL